MSSNMDDHEFETFNDEEYDACDVPIPGTSSDTSVRRTRSTAYHHHDSRSASPHDRTPEYRQREYQKRSVTCAPSQPPDEQESPDLLFVIEEHPEQRRSVSGRKKGNTRTRRQRSKVTTSFANSLVAEPIDDALEAQPSASFNSSAHVHESAAQIQTSPTADTMTAIRARTTKFRITQNSATKRNPKKKTGGRKPIEQDPINIMIKDLKCKGNMSWEEISAAIDNQLINQGEAPLELSVPAIYGRFTRNAPRIAKALGEVGFNPKDFLYMRHPHYYPTANQYVTASKRGGKAAHDGGIPPLLKGNVRVPAANQKDLEELQSAEMTDALRSAVDIVNDNFYMFVADEMERITGKFYDLKALEARHNQAQAEED